MTGDKSMSKSFPLGMKNTNQNPGGRVFGDGAQDTRPASGGHSTKKVQPAPKNPKGR